MTKDFKEERGVRNPRTTGRMDVRTRLVTLERFLMYGRYIAYRVDKDTPTA